MKLKRLPSDFRVEEETALQAAGGPFALYRLNKSGLATPEAIDAILRKWNLPRGVVAYAGLKDKHAETSQAVTIRNGPRRGFEQEHFALEYVGQTGRPVHARDIVANRFSVVLRDMTPGDVQAAQAAAEQVARDGVANYFDNQRFGSLGESGEFIARPWCLGDYERALWLALAEPNVHDRGEEREQKAILRECWGKWAECKQRLARSHRRSVITYLADKPGDFKRALALVRQDLRSIWLAAFQSHLWNQVLAAFISDVCQSERLLWQTIGRRDVPFFFELNEAQRASLHWLVIPLPSARLHLEPGPVRDTMDRVLQAEGLERREIRVKYPRDAFFSKGERPAILRPGDLRHASASDDLYAERTRLTLEFRLPRGSYATILVKRIAGFSDEIADLDGTAPT